MPDPPELEYLFTWLHLSDLHFGHPNREYRQGQKGVLRDLLADLKGIANGRWRNDAPTPTRVIVTGDVAFRAAKSEYDDAAVFFGDVGSLLGVEPSEFYLVPGNHDVVRGTKEGDPLLYAVLARIEEPAHLTDMLANA